MLYASEGLIFGLRPNALGLRTGPFSSWDGEMSRKSVGSLVSWFLVTGFLA